MTSRCMTFKFKSKATACSSSAIKGDKITEIDVITSTTTSQYGIFFMVMDVGGEDGKDNNWPR